MIRLFLLCPALFFSVMNAIAQYPNILIGNTNSANEPSIMINPKNTDQMVAGSNINNYYYSSDAGTTWTSGQLSSPYGVWGDPVIIVDTTGNFYFLHLSNPSSGEWIDRIVSQKSTNGGQTWSTGTFMGLNGSKDQDKEWGVVNRMNNHIYVTWTQFDNYGSFNSLDSSVILFSKSINSGVSWSPPKRINRVAGDCLDMDNTVEGAVPAVGPNGEIYVSWAGPLGLVFNSSPDGGNTWNDTNIFVCSIPGGWDYMVGGIYRANGLPVTCCDLSNGPSHGNVYINWSDQRNGTTDTDVWFVKSTDGGLSWCAPKRVNDDPPGRQQFFTWMTVDQVTGYIYFVFYDRRNYTDNRTDVYMAVSRDGGETFENFKISDSPFNPNAGVFFGDYTCVSAHNNVVRPIWTRLQYSALSVWTATIDSINVGTGPDPKPYVSLSLDQNYPNPVKEHTYFSYKVHSPTKVTLKVFNILGKEIASLFQDKMVNAGKYIEYFDVSGNRFPPGIYYFSLTTGEQTLKRKMIID
ncbi:MAG: T9SS type A sorting domain-containing protein [Bacteroidota bacterium]